MVSVPVRLLAVLFAFTEKPTVPLPLPLAPDVTCVHPWLLTAVQVQPEGAVTFTLPVPPLEPKEPDGADSEYVQATPASLTVKAWPAIVSVPLRLLAVLFAFTENPTVPLPVPLAPEVTCVHPWLLTAVQLQPDPDKTVTFTLPVPPAAEKDALGADNWYVHGGGGGGPDGPVATAIGYTPTCARVFITALVATEICDSLKALRWPHKPSYRRCLSQLMLDCYR